MLKTLIRPATAQPAERYDITRGSLARNIWYMGWPIVLSQLLFMAPNLYDAIWLGRLGSGAQAAAGLATSIRMTMISVLMALSSGGGAVVARYLGAKDEENANLAVLQSVLLMIVASGLLGVVGVVFAEPLMRLAGADDLCAVCQPVRAQLLRLLDPGYARGPVLLGPDGRARAACSALRVRAAGPSPGSQLSYSDVERAGRARDDL